MRPLSLRESGRVDVVQGLEDHRREEALLGRDVEEASVVAGDLTLVLDPQYVPRPVGELVEEAPQYLAEARELRDELGALADGTGAFMACIGTAPRSAIATCSAAVTPALSCASAVLAPRCGVTTTLGSEKSGESVVGSLANTSSAAPAMVPSLSALYRAISSTMPPRATFMR